MQAIDRKPLKERSKELIRTVQPPVWQVAAVFLLVSTGVQNLLGAFNPVAANMNNLYNSMLQASASGDMEQLSRVMLRLSSQMSGPGATLRTLITVVVSLAITVVTYGFAGYCLSVTRGKEADFSDLFSRFYMAGQIIVAEILQGVFAALWMLLGLVPPIIVFAILGAVADSMGLIMVGVFIGYVAGMVLAVRAVLSYSMIMYCMVDDSDCPVMEAFRRSKEMMKDRKWELLVLEFSFFGWMLLAVFVMALVSGLVVALPALIAAIVSTAAAVACFCLLQPYMGFTVAQWYDAIRPRTEQSGI